MGKWNNNNLNYRNFKFVTGLNCKKKNWMLSYVYHVYFILLNIIILGIGQW